MLNGHGDDSFRYDNIRINFSSNIYNHFNHEGLFRHLASHLDEVKNYPEPTPASLEAAIANHLDLKPEEVMVTNGCTEAIYLIAQAFRGFDRLTNRGTHSTILTPTFSEYADACRMHGHKVLSSRFNPQCSVLRNSVPELNPDVSVNLLWLCNPNNPTGTVIPKETLIKDIESHPETIFIIDASYAPYTTKPLLSLKEAPLSGAGGLLLLHSMTKEYGVPGLRIGYVTGSARLLQRIRACRMPWSVSPLAIEAGKYLLHHNDEFRIDAEALCIERQRVAEALSATGKIEAFPSDTHILLCRLKHDCLLRHITAPALKEHLAIYHGILIRDASNFEGLDDSYFRIAIQSPEENDTLIDIMNSEL